MTAQSYFSMFSGVLVLLFANDVLAVAIADDNWFSSEESTQTITWTSSKILNPPTNYKFLYKHWGDGGAAPPGFTDKQAGTGRKPPWPAGWNGVTYSNDHTTTHAKGSASTSQWSLSFTSRNVLGVGYPGINGKLKAIADKNNATLSSTDAHTRTDWSDPFEFEILSGESATFGVRHRFTNDSTSGDVTSASWTPDSNGLIESGWASVFRRYVGQITDETGAWGAEGVLQFVQIGTGSDLVQLELGSGVTLDDGSSYSQKESELKGYLNASTHTWALPIGNSVLLDFTWSIPAVDYDRTVRLDLSGGVMAEEAQIPEPPPFALFGIGLLVSLRLMRWKIGSDWHLSKIAVCPLFPRRAG